MNDFCTTVEYRLANTCTHLFEGLAWRCAKHQKQRDQGMHAQAWVGVLPRSYVSTRALALVWQWHMKMCTQHLLSSQRADGGQKRRRPASATQRLPKCCINWIPAHECAQT